MTTQKASGPITVGSMRLAMPSPHRLVLWTVGLVLVLSSAMFLRWDWLPSYGWAIARGVGVSILLLAATSGLGFLIAIPIGLAQAGKIGPVHLAARGFCTVIRGTPLLLQLWLLYYGVGSFFPMIPGLRETWIWPYLRQAWPYATVALTLSFAGNSGEIMRGAFVGVPRGILEAARSLGMKDFSILGLIWLPLAVRRALPTLAGETVLQLKATPLVATITVMDVYAVFARIRQDTYLTYEPLLLLALVYIVLTGMLVTLFDWMEARLARGRN